MKGYLKRREVIEYISMYETKELGLVKDKMYDMRKNALLRHRFIKLDEFKDFIDDTKNFPFTRFQYGEKSLKAEQLSSKTIFDVINHQILYYKFPFELKAIKKMLMHLKAHRNRKYLILDLSDNETGEIDAGVLLANCLTQNCELFRIRYKHKEERYFSDRDQLSFDKIFIVVNEHSGHISELLTLTLHGKLDNVTVIGSSTRNKRIGQEYFAQKKRQALKLSSYQWEVGNTTVEDILSSDFNGLDDLIIDLKE